MLDLDIERNGHSAGLMKGGYRRWWDGGKAGHRVCFVPPQGVPWGGPKQRARARKALLLLATGALLMMHQGASASGCRTTVAAGSYHVCAILVHCALRVPGSMFLSPWVFESRSR